MPTFHSIEDFLEYLPHHELLIVEALRNIISEALPGVVERLSYDVPYYYGKSRICFIWPASVPWGKVNLNGVQLGFCQGYRLNDSSNYLQRGNRKQVYVKTFFKPEEIDRRLIQSYLFEAEFIDNQLRGKK